MWTCSNHTLAQRGMWLGLTCGACLQAGQQLLGGQGGKRAQLIVGVGIRSGQLALRLQGEACKGMSSHPPAEGRAEETWPTLLCIWEVEPVSLNASP